MTVVAADRLFRSAAAGAFRRAYGCVLRRNVAKVWLITCKCRALVQALTEAVLASGQNVVTTAVDAATVADLAERYGNQLRIVPVDVTSARAAGIVIQATLDAFGRLDVLVLDLAKWRSGAGQEALEQIAALTNADHRENKATPSARATWLGATIHRLSIGVGRLVRLTLSG